MATEWSCGLLVQVYFCTLSGETGSVLTLQGGHRHTHTHSLARELITWNLVRRDFQSLFYCFYVTLKSFISHLHHRPKFSISDISFHFLWYFWLKISPENQSASTFFFLFCFFIFSPLSFHLIFLSFPVLFKKKSTDSKSPQVI